jgi:hypothetical protein
MFFYLLHTPLIHLDQRGSPHVSALSLVPRIEAAPQ